MDRRTFFVFSAAALLAAAQARAGVREYATPGRFQDAFLLRGGQALQALQQVARPVGRHAPLTHHPTVPHSHATLPSRPMRAGASSALPECPCGQKQERQQQRANQAPTPGPQPSASFAN